MHNKIVILLSRRKAIITLLGASLLAVFASLAAMEPESFVSPIFRSMEIVRISGIAGVCFFGISIIVIGWKLFDNKPGLTIDEFGITDNTNATSIGLIEWGDITTVEKRQVMSTKFLLLHVNNPDKYIQKAKNVISKRALAMNLKVYGTPISITPNSLRIDFDELETLITQKLKRRSKK